MKYSRPHKMEEYRLSKEERDMLEKMRKIDEFSMEEFGTLYSSEKATAILLIGDEW